MADFNVNRRLKRLIEEQYRTSPFAFSQKYNDNGGVKTSAIIRERNGVSNKMLDLITGAYPEINRNWLLTGEGEMIKKTDFSDSRPMNFSTTVSMPREVWDAINARDRRLDEIIEIMKSRDEQIDRMFDRMDARDDKLNVVITMLQNQINKADRFKG